MRVQENFMSPMDTVTRGILALSWDVNRQTLFTVGICQSGQGPKNKIGFYRFLSFFVGFLSVFKEIFLVLLQ